VTSVDRMGQDGSVTVSVTVSNTGSRAGDEVVQLYVRHPSSRVPRPRQELKGFRRVSLEPGESKLVSFRLAATELAYWDTSQGCFTVEPGDVELLVGRSSQHIELRRTIAVLG
jgi:beta-glucosidase